MTGQATEAEKINVFWAPDYQIEELPNEDVTFELGCRRLVTKLFRCGRVIDRVALDSNFNPSPVLAVCRNSLRAVIFPVRTSKHRNFQPCTCHTTNKAGLSETKQSKEESTSITHAVRLRGPLAIARYKCSISRKDEQKLGQTILFEVRSFYAKPHRFIQFYFVIQKLANISFRSLHDELKKLRSTFLNHRIQAVVYDAVERAVSSDNRLNSSCAKKS